MKRLTGIAAGLLIAATPAISREGRMQPCLYNGGKWIQVRSTDNIAIKRHSRTVTRLATAVYCIPRIKKSKDDALKVEQQLKELDVTA